MEYVLTGKEMKALDLYAIREIGIPSVVLMEKAAEAVVRRVEESYRGGTILVLCGVGNNGADGLCVYRMLKHKQYPCDCLVIGNREKETQEFQLHRHILEKLGINIRQEKDWKEPFLFQSYSYLVDALFGVGLTREIQGDFALAVEAVNASGAYVCAVDMPSGVSSDDGHICGCAVRADETVTFGFLKVGNLCYPGKTYCGKITIADIGYETNFGRLLGFGRYCCTDRDLKEIPKRNPAGHKGTFGKVLIVAGSKEYSGAALFSAEAAYRMGAGLVKIVTHRENKNFLQQSLPEALHHFYETQEELLSGRLEESIRWADVIVAGCGLGMSREAEQLVDTVLEAECPLVLDADALNLISRNKWQNRLKSRMVITPHLKEMERLAGKSISEIEKNPEAAAMEFSSTYGCTVVLKDAVTVVTDGSRICYNTSGNCGMATGGSGDVLAGILGGCLLWENSFEKTALGVYLHGKMGDKAAEKKGTHAMLASDILEQADILKVQEEQMIGE